MKMSCICVSSLVTHRPRPVSVMDLNPASDMVRHPSAIMVRPVRIIHRGLVLAPMVWIARTRTAGG